MFDRSIMRRLEVNIGDGWVECNDLGRLMTGDVFRMFEPNGEPVEDGAGVREWIVEETPSVKCRPHHPQPVAMSNKGHS